MWIQRFAELLVVLILAKSHPHCSVVLPANWLSVLKETLDRLDASMWEEISDVEQLKGSDDSKLLQRWRIPGTEIAIPRALGGPMQGEYLFDADTVDRAKDFYFLVQDLPSRQEGHQEYAVGIY